ncbi:MAG: tetratricopeptide repeat protein, partial [Victivallales bacterium]|nr:tetratricopeptide repeat protein [Victivallales bacterium]
KELSGLPQASAEQRFQAAMNAAVCLGRSGDLQLAFAQFKNAEPLGGTLENRAEALYCAAKVATDAAAATTLLEDASSPCNYVEEALNLFQKVAEEFPATPAAPNARFDQATLLAERQRLVEAAEAYARFAADYPLEERHDLALLYRGVCLRKAAKTPDELLAAARYLDRFADSIKDQEIADQALLESFRAAKDGGSGSQAHSALTRILSRQTSKLRSEALFQNSVLFFTEQRIPEMRADADKFFSEYATLPLADELHILVGDTYANEGNWQEALKHYISPVNSKMSPDLLPVAYYESAHCCYKLEDDRTALSHINGLLDIYRENDPQPLSEDTHQILARAHYLKGDILAQDGHFHEARDEYAASRNEAGDTILGFTALGRQGEMSLEIARVLINDKQEDDPQTHNAFQTAEKCFQTIIDNNPFPSPLYLMARYRQAVCYASQKASEEAALDTFKDLIITYRDHCLTGEPRNDFYFANAVYEVCRILERKGDELSLTQAKNYYKMLIERNLPTSATARERLKALEHRKAK